MITTLILLYVVIQILVLIPLRLMRRLIAPRQHVVEIHTTIHTTKFEHD